MRFFTPFRYILLLALLITTGGAVVADDDRFTWPNSVYNFADSLKQLINSQPITEKRKMELYREIAGQYQTIELDSSKVYLTKSIAMAQELKEYDILTDSYISLGINHSFQGNYEAAFSCFDRAKELAVEHGNKEMEAIVLSSTGFTYAKQGKHNTAIDYYLKYLKVSENEGWNENCIRALANLSEISRRLGNTETAIQYLKIAEEKCNKYKEFITYNWWMSQICNEYAFNYFNKGDYDKAFFYALKADTLLLAGNTINKCYAKGLLASIYLYRNDYDQALFYAQESYKQADILKDVSLYVNAGKILSDVYLAQKHYPEAEAEAFKAWQIDSTNIDESRALLENIALANIYMGNREKAAYYLKKNSELNALYSEKSFQTTASDLSVKYETEKKEVRIALLEKERWFYVWLSMAGILFAFALGIVLLQNKRNARKERQLFAVEAIQKGEISERERIAKDLHDHLGGSLSAIKMELKNKESLQVISKRIDECITELREIVQDIMPQSMQYGMKRALEDFSIRFPNLHFHFFGEDRHVNFNLEHTVFCCAKELAINALKHSGAANINLQLVQSEKYISLTVQDDGCGFDDKTVVKGNGLKNIRNRVNSYKGKIDIISAPGKGTEAVIELKIEN